MKKRKKTSAPAKKAELSPITAKLLGRNSPGTEEMSALVSLFNAGHPAEAEKLAREMTRHFPGHGFGWKVLGAALKELGRLPEAVNAMEKAAQLLPKESAVHSNLAVALMELGQLNKAEASCRLALALRPDNATAHFNLGVILFKRGALTEAEASCRRSLTLQPDQADVYNTLGATLQAQGRRVDAEASLRRSLALRPDYEWAYSNLLFVLNYDPDKTAEEIFADYREYDVRFGLPHRPAWRAHANRPDLNRRLKIGYVSPDFYRHSVRHFLEPLLAHHDRQTWEVVAYAEMTREDEVTVRYKGYVDQWVTTVGMSDAQLAERIRADQIDILVDLAGQTASTARNRLGVFARKPAPVSVSWMIGFGYTTGLSAIDYFLTDETCAPPGSENLFAEQPWRLATPGLVYRPAEGMGPVSPLPALERGYVTFGSLSRAIRINHRTIKVWAEILRRVEGSRLVVDSGNFQDTTTLNVLAVQLVAHGVSQDRLAIGCHSPPWDVLRGMDIGLDCFPHNSGTTLFETLYMGLPFVTLAGRPSVGWLGSAILEGVGHPEWIAHTEEGYVEKAVALAADLSKLATLRAGLREEMEQGPLMDEARFACKVETAYRAMFEKWRHEFMESSP